MNFKIKLVAIATLLFVVSNANAQSTTASNVLTGTQTAPAQYLGSSTLFDVLFKTNNIERMRMQSSTGNIGIGATSPFFKLHVNGANASGQVAAFDNATYRTWLNVKATVSAYNNLTLTNDNGIYWQDDATIESANGFVIAPWSGSTKGLRIDGATGNVGIGIASPGYKLQANDIISSQKSGRAGYNLYNGGGVSEWFLGQESNTSNNFKIQSLVSGVYTNVVDVTSTGNVGIGTGTASILSKLQVTNGSILFDGTTGTTPTSGAGTRMMWIPAKAAFRAGAVSGTQWDDASVGTYSNSIGFNTIASGYASFACGYGTTASGNSASFVCGNANIASGSGAFATGSSTISSGNVSSTFGSLTTASGTYSAAFGSNTNAQSSNSFVIGKYNINPGTYNPTAWVTTEPLFVIGNGTSATATNNAVTVLKNGNMLINQATQVNAIYKLDVNGSVRANEVVVNTTGADFVFENDYKLTPLKSLEENIKQNKHLPGIASAADMQENGVGLAELNKNLLQKVEELTLYLIEQNKQIVDQKKELTEQNKRIEVLEKSK
jgi:hypothetical protein